MPDGLSAPLTNVRRARFHAPVDEPINLQAVEKALAVIISGGQPRQTDLHVEVRPLEYRGFLETGRRGRMQRRGSRRRRRRQNHRETTRVC